MDELIIQEEVNSHIFTLRGKEVMLSRDLAVLYKVETKVLDQAVKRNIKRFPSDFMFQLSEDEFINWKSQYVTSNADKMGLRRAPYAFTQQGVYMFSTVLKSKIALLPDVSPIQIDEFLLFYVDNIIKRINRCLQQHPN